MKRIILSVFALFSVVNVFAYYGDYSYGHREDDSIFMNILIIIAGILWIILFFKVWGMTDDIRSIKKEYFSENKFTDNRQAVRYLRKNLILGNIDNVKCFLLQNFADNVEHAYNKMKFGSYEEDEKGNRQWVSYRERNMKKSIEPYVKNLELQFEKIGEKTPIYISRMKTFGDYFDIFVEGNLSVEVKENTTDC